jgi:hypothetical protein
MLRFAGKAQPRFGHLLKDALMRDVFDFFSEPTALLCEFSVILRCFHG